MLNRFRCRLREPELMDQPGLEERLHRGALVGLRRINRISGSGRIVWKAARTSNCHERVADLARARFGQRRRATSPSTSRDEPPARAPVCSSMAAT